jgi:hypothetical protein
MAAYDQNGQRHIKLLLAAALNAALEYRNTVAGSITQLRIDCDTAPSGGSVVFTLYKIVSGTKTTIGTATLAAGAHVATASFASALTGGETVGVDMGLPPSAIGNALTITVSVTEPAPSGSGGGARYPFVPPASPSAWDDEFEATTRDAKWTDTTTSGATYDFHTTIASCVCLRANGNYSLSLTQAFVPGAGDFSVTMCSYGAWDTNNQNHLLALQDASGNNIIRWVFYNAGGTVSHYCDINAGFTTSLSNTNWQGGSPYVGRIFLHMQRVSGTYELYFSTHGYSWRRIHTVALATTVGKMWLFAGQNGVTTKARHAIDFVRANWLTLP